MSTPRSTGTPTTGVDPDPTELARFMAAIRQHENGGSYAWTEDYARSGHHGAYQIGGPEWLAWSALAGVNPADHSQAAQDKVAAGQFVRYFRQFGTWRGVAIAWYGGPAKAAKDAKNPGSVDHIGNPTIGQYLAEITTLMGSADVKAVAGGVSPSDLIGGAGDLIGGAADTLTGGATGDLAGLFDFVWLLTSWDTWRRIMLVVGGGGLVVLGLAMLGADLGGVVSTVTELSGAMK